ncbi:MAG: BLUF domain-containing protein [Bacteroidota bacterium]
MQPSLLQLVYASSSPWPLSREDIAAILHVSRSNNARDGLTGVLLYADGSFMQVLEGPPDAVAATYQRIHRDPRHGDVLHMLEQRVEQRSFPEWTMGLVRPDDLSTEDRSAVNTVFELTHPSPDRARRLLSTFRRIVPAAGRRVM